MTFWRALRSTYSGSVAFIVACALLAFVPVFFELLQHAVEVHRGMYVSIAGARAAATDPVRLGFGFLKVIALTVSSYWVTRYLASRDASFAKRASRTAVRLFLAYMSFQLTVAAVMLFLVPQTSWAQITSLVVGQIVNCLVVAWGVAAPLGNAAVGPRASAALMFRQLPWTFVFLLVAVLPLMIPHYAMAYLSIGAKSLLWPILIVDSLLVGWLNAVIIASNFFAATRASIAAGVSLFPPDGETLTTLLPPSVIAAERTLSVPANNLRRLRLAVVIHD